MPSTILRAALLAATLFILSGPSQAQEASPPQGAAAALTVGVLIDPPFVMEDGEGYSGMAIELWQKLAERAGLQFQYREYPNFHALVEATANSETDVAVTNLTINRERAERVDFTHPWFDAGHRVMVNENSGAGLGNVIEGLRASGHLTAYAWIAFVIVMATVLLTLFDRRFDKNFPRRWPDGIAESFYTVMSVATSGKPPSRTNLFGWVGRIWQGLWLVCGIAVLAYVTSSVTSVMTTLAITSDISSAADLPGRTVGVLRGSVSEDYARKAGLRFRSFDHLEDGVQRLINGRIDAIVGDAPVLEYYAATHPDQPVSVVGALFDPIKYGFALPNNSPLTRMLSVELIGAHESGELEALRTRYFGEHP